MSAILLMPRMVGWMDGWKVGRKEGR